MKAYWLGYHKIGLRGAPCCWAAGKGGHHDVITRAEQAWRAVLLPSGDTLPSGYHSCPSQSSSRI